jgi:hypothetical protein
VRLPGTPYSKRLLKVLAILIAITTGVQVGGDTRLLLRAPGARPHIDYELTDFLQRKGFQPGEKVATIGGACFANWARLARVRIVAEIPPRRDFADPGLLSADELAFWAGSDELRSQVMEVFRRTGARAATSIGSRWMERAPRANWSCWNSAADAPRGNSHRD